MRVRSSLFLVLCVASAVNGRAAQIAFSGLNASLTSGSLNPTNFPVSFSYDASQILPVGDSFIALESFDFTLLGALFTKNEISQGGQVVFHDGVLGNVTASYQGTQPPGSPVHNITFGFGGPGIIGYRDLSDNFGGGAFIFTPEPGITYLVGAGLCCMVCRRLFLRRNQILGGTITTIVRAGNLLAPR